ncbi:hypothetical protein PENTCL1PPCAC_1990, partial [Pristionchus entomophagus]
FRQYPSRIICPSDQWFINGNLFIVGKPFCNRRHTSPNEVGWFMMTRDKERVEITTAECYQKIDCTIHSSLKQSAVCPIAKCDQSTTTK